MSKCQQRALQPHPYSVELTVAVLREPGEISPGGVHLLMGEFVATPPHHHLSKIRDVHNKSKVNKPFADDSLVIPVLGQTLAMYQV